jgi:hypothetical protein
VSDGSFSRLRGAQAALRGVVVAADTPGIGGSSALRMPRVRVSRRTLPLDHRSLGIDPSGTP